MSNGPSKKPLPIVIFAILALINGVAGLALGVMTLLGSEFLFTPGGYGPNRIAISELFGPLAPQAGWIVSAIGLAFVSIGYGLFTLQNWARLTIFYPLAVLACATVIAVGWGFYQREWGVVVGGILKIAVEVAVCLYLTSARVRNAFAA